MQPVFVPGSSSLQSRVTGLLGLAALVWAGLLVGCAGGSSGGGTGGKTDGGGTGGRAGATGSGGRSGTGGSGIGGSGIGGSGTGGEGTGGMGTGGMGTGGSTVCADAGNDAGDNDTDYDGVADCLDGCPNDRNKTAPGVCGCGLPDSDTDGDGFLDCVDACPQDATRHTAGLCGCSGIPDSTPMCLVHRYSFNDDGTTTATIADSITIAGGVSPANGTAFGARPAAGRIVLAGGSSSQIGGQYVGLPTGIISALGNNATFEAWVTWNPVVGSTNGPWQRVLDFGNSDQPDAGAPGNGRTYLFMSPSNGNTQTARTALTLNGGGTNEDVTDATGSLPTGLLAHIAVVVNGSGKLMTMYIDVGATSTASSVAMRNVAELALISDVNNWLGRSQWLNDQLFAGSFEEFRIYSRALTAAEVAASAAAGPNALPAPVDGGTGDGPRPDGGAGDTSDVSSSPDAGTDVPVGG